MSIIRLDSRQIAGFDKGMFFLTDLLLILMSSLKDKRTKEPESLTGMRLIMTCYDIETSCCHIDSHQL